MKNLFRNLSFSKKWYGTVAVMILLFVIVIAISLAALGRTKRSYENFVDNDYEVTKTIKDSKVQMLLAANSINEFVQQPSKVDEYREIIKNYQSNINSLLKDLEQDELLLKYTKTLDDWFLMADKLIEAVKTRNNITIKDIVLKENPIIIKQVLEAAEQFESNTDKMAQENADKSVLIASGSIIIVDILFVITLVICVVMSKLMRQSIFNALSQVKNAVKEMEKGNLKAEIKYKSKDEFGEVTESLRSSMAILSAYVTNIDKAMVLLSNGNFNITSNQPFIGDFKNIEKSISEFTIKMSDILKRINEVSDKVSENSEQVSNGAQSLAQGSTEQASSIEELSSAIAGIAEQVKENAKSATLASEKAEIAGQLVGSSNTKMYDMVNAMKNITQKSEEIEKIIKTINDIAFQTNILALNAAVEAARAGTAGKGFAVVADEVRNLANKTAEAAKDTTSLIAQSMKAVENGSAIADKTAEELISTVQITNETVKFINQIACASNEQAETIEQVTSGVERISSVVQQNSYASQQSAAASQELSGHANVLRSLTSQFELVKSEHSFMHSYEKEKQSQPISEIKHTLKLDKY